MKVLVCGDVLGNFSVLAARIHKLNTSRHGPFDLLLCVGEWSASGGSDVAKEEGTTSFPIPVHILGDRPGKDAFDLAGSHDNVFFLGKYVVGSRF